jgi:hypothetical protein
MHVLHARVGRSQGVHDRAVDVDHSRPVNAFSRWPAFPPYLSFAFGDMRWHRYPGRCAAARGPPQAGTQRYVQRWTVEEHAELERLVGEMGVERKWSLIAGKMPGRSGKQCRERWLNHLRCPLGLSPSPANLVLHSHHALPIKFGLPISPSQF